MSICLRAQVEGYRVGCGRVGGREASSHIFLFIFLSALSHPLGALIAHSWHSFWPRPAVRDLFSRHPSCPAPCSNNITPVSPLPLFVATNKMISLWVEEGLSQTNRIRAAVSRLCNYFPPPPLPPHLFGYRSALNSPAPRQAFIKDISSDDFII